MSEIKGPGLLYVNSGIARPDILSEETYIKWYSDDHIAEIMQTSAIHSALRFKDVDAAASKPYLVMYPMEDIGFTQGEEFRKIKVHSDMLPGGGPIYDLADIDVRYYGLIQKFEPNGPVKEGTIHFVATAAIELGDGTSEQEFDDWYRKEVPKPFLIKYHSSTADYHLKHLLKISQVPGFIRSTRFKLLYSRTNAQSRALKGLPSRDADVAIQEPPPWLALHEFTDALDLDAFLATGTTEWSKKMIANMKRIEYPLYRHMQSYGDGKFFH